MSTTITTEPLMLGDSDTQALNRYILWLGHPKAVGIVGRETVIHQMGIAFAADARGVLLEGPPGTAKTTITKVLADNADLSQCTIQGTPDLRPLDLIGYEVPDESQPDGKRFVPGPVHHNIVLAEEANRMPPKTLSALLQPMQGRTTSVGNRDYPVPTPFLLMATQNPTGGAGTYEPPEMWTDRFTMSIWIPRLKYAERGLMLNKKLFPPASVLSPGVTGKTIEQVQEMARTRIVVGDDVETKLNDCIEITNTDPRFAWGAGERAIIDLAYMARAEALLKRDAEVLPAHIRACFRSAVRHRVILKKPEINPFVAQARIEEILGELEVQLFGEAS